jgi:hypothetical protein
LARLHDEAHTALLGEQANGVTANVVPRTFVISTRVRQA